MAYFSSEMFLPCTLVPLSALHPHNDILCSSWGVAATTEYEMDEVMPSCCPLMILDYIYAKCFQSKYQQPVPDWISPMS